MTETPKASDTEDIALQAALDEMDEEDRRVQAILRKRRLQMLGVAAVFVGLMGMIPMFFGVGPFASRVLFASRVDVHVLNTSGQQLRVEVSYTAPLNIGPMHLDSVRTLTGPLTIRTFSVEGEELESFELRAQRPILYNAMANRCLVVFDISSMYRSDEESVMRIVRRIQPDEPIYETYADTLILPRRPNPPTARGTVHWIEDFGCDLVNMEDDTFLLARAEMRLTERWERMQEAMGQ